eukprot:SAG22_NODE_60_length_23423_cov_8.445250_14_plen_283_part_00
MPAARAKPAAAQPPAKKAKKARRAKKPAEVLAGLIVGHAELQGERATMEDALCALSPWHAQAQFKHIAGSAHFLGVFDGHGGRDAADYAAENLVSELEASLRAGLPPSAAMVTAHLATEVGFLRASAGGEAGDGTTAISMLVCGATGTITAANLGDSRAFVVKRPPPGKRKAKAKFVALSTDQVCLPMMIRTDNLVPGANIVTPIYRQAFTELYTHRPAGRRLRCIRVPFRTLRTRPSSAGSRPPVEQSTRTGTSMTLCRLRDRSATSTRSTWTLAAGVGAG